MRVRWKTNEAHRIVSTTRPDRLRNLRALVHCEIAGPPLGWPLGKASRRGALGVDIATGRAIVCEPELVLPGPLPLRWFRYYSSGWAHRESPLGRGWSHSLDLSLWLEPDRIVVQHADGRELEFDTFGATERTLRSALEDVALTRNSDGYALEVDHGRLRYVFAEPSPRGRLLRIERPEGLRIELGYDDRGRIDRATEPGGRSLRFGYSGDALDAVWIHDKENRERLRVARFERSADGDLVLAQDGNDRSLRYEYHQHLLVARRDRSERSTYFGYDGSELEARVVRTWTDGGHDRELDYRPSVGRVTVSDAMDRKIAYRFDAVHNLLERGLERFVRDDHMRLVKHVDARGAVTLLQRDDNGHCVEVTLPDGARWSIKRDPAGRPIAATDPRGGAWQFSWDSFGRLMEQHDPAGEVIRYEYERFLLRAIDRSSGTRLGLQYDPYLALEQVMLPGGLARDVFRDWLGRPVRRREPGHVQQGMRYDKVGRVSEHFEQGGPSRAFSCDAEGRLERTEHGERWEYDGAGSLSAFESRDLRFELERDREQRITAVRTSSFGAWRFERDRAGRVTQEIDPAERRFVYRYGDASDSPTTLFLPGRRQLDFSYDLRDRITRVLHSDHTTEEYEHDLGGELTRAVRRTIEPKGRRLVPKEHVVRFERDAMGRIIREELDDHWVQMHRDRDGRLIAMETSLGASILIRWDAAARVGELVYGDHRSREPWTRRYERDRDGRATVLKASNGLTVQWETDADGRVVARNVARGSEIVDDARYERFSDGTFSSIRGRNLGAQKQARSTANDAEHAVAAPSFDPPGFTRDAFGALVKRDWHGREVVFRYSASGLVIGETVDGGLETVFEYDAFGRLCCVTRQDETRYWVWAGARLVHEMMAPNVRTQTWIYEPGQRVPVARIKDGSNHRCVLSREDEPSLGVCDDRGDVVMAGWYDADGVLHATTHGTPWPWRNDGTYDDAATRLVWHPCRPLWLPAVPYGSQGDSRALVPDPRGVWAIFGRRLGAWEAWQPASWLWAWRVSDEAFDALVRQAQPYLPLEMTVQERRDSVMPSFARPDLDGLVGELPLGIRALREDEAGPSPAPWLLSL